MQLRALPILLALALIPSLTGCDIGEIKLAGFRFTAPMRPTPSSPIRTRSSCCVCRARRARRPGVGRRRAARRELVHEERRSGARIARRRRAGPPRTARAGHAEPLLPRSRGAGQTSASFEKAAEPSFVVRESLEQLQVSHAEADAELEVIDAEKNVVDSGFADYQGSLIFREVEPGDGYRVVTPGFPREASPALRVLSVEASTPEQSFYDNQVLQEGYGYLTTRDGTKLSVFVALPGPPEDGPYPVLVNYSGYDPSQPVGELEFSGINLCAFLGNQFPLFCNAPDRARSARCRRPRLRDGGRQHARHRLLRRRLRLLRAAPAHGRLRHHRDRRRAAVGLQGRHGRHLVPGHLAALRGEHAPAEPRCDHAARGDLRCRHHDESRRHRQRRLRGRVGLGGARARPTPTGTAGSRDRSTTATSSAKRTSSCTRRRSTSSRRRTTTRSTRRRSTTR